MGTVPDPLRSAKLSVVSTSAEEEHLGDVQPAKQQPQAPSSERASNGFPCAPPSSAGLCLFDVSCAGAASTQGCEQCHTDHDSLQEAFSPGLASTAAEGHPADVKPAGCSQPPAGIQAPAVPALAAAGALSAGRGPDMMPAPQSSRQFVQGSQAKTSSLTQIDDSALKPQGTDDQPALAVLNYSSPGDPVGVNQFCHSSQANLLQRGERDRAAEKNGSTVCQSALPAGKTEADPGRDPQSILEAKSGAADMAQFHPPDKTETAKKSEAPAQPGQGSPRPVHNLDPTPGSPNPTQLSKFRETGTMTAQPESSPSTQEAVSRTWRDAEVQAVATVESKSASTSPSIFAAFLKGNLPPEEKEELHIIYQGGMGLSQAALTDSLSSQQKFPCSPGLTPKSTVVAVTASAQTLPVKPPAVPSDVVSPVSADNAKRVLPCSPAAVTSQGTPMGDAEMTSAARDVRDAAQLPVDAPAPPKPTPVERLDVDSSSQTPSQPGTGAGEPSPAATDAVPGTKSDGRDLVPHAGSSRSPLLCGTDREGKQEVLGSSEQKPVQSKGASQGEASPNQSVVKPKAENLVVLDAKGGLNVSSQPATVHVKATSEHAGDESRGHGDSGQSQMAGGQNLQAGLTPALSVSSAGLAPPVAASAAPQQQQGLQARESQHELHPAVIPASAQAVPNLGENKKHSTPAMEAKVQVKQSKHVRDVVWDEQGMTWEVYGASLDPESLGIAIQNHLQRQIREHEKLIRAQNSQTRKSISSDTSSNKKLKGRQHNMFQSMLQNFRRPNCCVRPAPSSVLD